MCVLKLICVSKIHKCIPTHVYIRINMHPYIYTCVGVDFSGTISLVHPDTDSDTQAVESVMAFQAADHRSTD